MSPRMRWLSLIVIAMMLLMTGCLFAIFLSDVMNGAGATPIRVPRGGLTNSYVQAAATGALLLLEVVAFLAILSGQRKGRKPGK